MEHKIDVRTLLLYKIKPGCQQAYNNLISHNKNDLFVTIGNYDALMVYPIKDCSKAFNEGFESQDDFLKMFLNEKKSLTEKYIYDDPCDCTHSTFYHPLHLVKHIEDENDNNQFKHFWSESNQRPFLVVTFVYGIFDNGLKNFETTVNKNIYENIIENVEYQIYRSINLSRLVVLWKGNSLKDILTSVSRFSACDKNVNTHTICGFRYSAENGGSIEDAKILDDDKIDMVKITGTIRSHAEAEKFFNEIDSLLNPNHKNYHTKFLAFGNNDFNLIYKNTPTKKIIKLLNDWMSHVDGEKCHQLEDAFSSIKTRVHTDYINWEKPNDSSYVTEVRNLFSPHLKTIDYFKSLNKEWAWPYHLIETLNMLKDMCKNPALSRTFHFVSDSLKTFCNALEDIKCHNENPKEIVEYNLNNLNEYTSSLNSLINQLTRVDGYLSQEPGFTPLIYNMIPAGLLEYYHSFIKFVIQTINKLSSSNNTNSCGEYSVLLFPTLSQFIQIDDVLIRNTQGKKPIFPPQQLYLLKIPYDMLYKPAHLLCAIVHEIMHFCGESIRCREQRFYAYLSFLAEAICSDFNIVCESNKTSNYLFEHLKNQISKDQDGIYIRNLTDISKKVVQSIYQDEVVKNNLYNFSLESIDEKDKIAILNKRRTINLSALYNKVSNQVYDIEYLFKESYADLITFILLGFNSDEYLKIILDDITKIPNNSDTEIILSTFIQRISLVIYTLKKCKYESIFNKKVDFDENINPYLTKVNELIKHLEMAESSIDFESEEFLYFPIRCLLNITDYLEECFKSFHKLYSDKQNKELFLSIMKYYNLSKDNNSFFSDEYCESLDNMNNESL